MKRHRPRKLLERVPGLFAPGPIRSVERKFQGAKRPENESSRERIGQGDTVLLELSLRGANWPGSEKAVNP